MGFAGEERKGVLLVAVGFGGDFWDHEKSKRQRIGSGIGCYGEGNSGAWL